MIHLYKRKGNPKVCDNHRSRHLPPVHCLEDTDKNILNRLNVHFDQKGLIPESQCGFSKNRGTIDSKTASAEMPKTECRSIHGVCRPHQSF